jgi:PPOX class probable F420-dependent enzyme
MAEMTTAQRDAFLSEARIATLVSLYGDGRPTAVPVWFEWDGEVARIFTGRASEKARRIRADSRVALTVAEAVGVPEAWVTIEGHAALIDEGGYALAQRLAPRYYSPERARQTLAEWGRLEGIFVVIAITPDRIRSSAPE